MRRGRESGGWGAALVCVGVIVACFWQVVFGDMHFFYRDASRLYLPERVFLFSEFAAGRFPLWFPFEGTGMPFFAQLSPGVLHPLNLVYALFSFAKAFQLNFVGCYLLAAVSTVWLLRLRGRGVAGCLVGGLAFAFSGAFSSQSNLLYLLGNASVPLALACAEWYHQRPSVWRALVGALGFTCLMLSGEPQSFVAAGIVSVLDAAFGACENRARARRLIGTVGLAIGGLAIAAVQLLPAWDLFGQSARMTEAERLHTFWSFPAARLLELVLPNAFGEDLAGRENSFSLLYPQREYPWAPNVFLGPVLVVLALSGALKKRENLGYALGAILFLWLSLGPDLGLEKWAAYNVPMWGGFRFPEKWLVFFGMCIAFMASDGVDHLGEVGFRSVTTGGAWGLLLLSVAAGVPGLFVAPGLWTKVFLDIWEGGLVVAFLSIGLLAVMRGRAFQARPVPSKAIVVVLTVLPLLVCNRDGIMLISKNELFRRPWVADAILDSHDANYPPRIMTASGGEVRSPTKDEMIALHMSMRSTLAVSFNTLFRIESFLNYHPGESSSYTEAFRRRPGELVRRILPIFNVKYLVLGEAGVTPPKYWRQIGVDPYSKVKLWESTRFLERTFVAQSAVFVSGVDEAVDRIVAPEFLPGDMVVTECPVSTDDARPQQRGTAELLAWNPQEVTVRASMQTTGILVLNDAFDSGWRAFDGQRELAVCRVNGLVRGVRLEPGTHEVRFVYRPRSFVVGAWISAIVLAGWGLAALASWVGRGRLRSPPGTSALR